MSDRTRGFGKSSLKLAVLSLFALTILSFSISASASSQLLSASGALKDNEGNPISDEVDMTFKLYTKSSGGSQVWKEEHSGVKLSNTGAFDLVLGSKEKLDQLDQQRWLEIKVNGETLDPRYKLGAPFALNAKKLADRPASTYLNTAVGALGHISMNGNHIANIGNNKIRIGTTSGDTAEIAVKGSSRDLRFVGEKGGTEASLNKFSIDSDEIEVRTSDRVRFIGGGKVQLVDNDLDMSGNAINNVVKINGPSDGSLIDFGSGIKMNGNPIKGVSRLEANEVKVINELNSSQINADDVKVSNQLDMKGNKIVDVSSPDDGSDAATKGYVDSEVSSNAGGGSGASGNPLTGDNCPSGWVDMGSYCIQKKESNSGSEMDWYAATNYCREKNATLCSMGEWYHACKTDKINNAINGNWEWVDNYDSTPDIFGFDTAKLALMMGNNDCKWPSSANMDAASTQFRCCKPPTK